MKVCPYLIIFPDADGLSCDPWTSGLSWNPTEFASWCYFLLCLLVCMQEYSLLKWGSWAINNQCSTCWRVTNAHFLTFFFKKKFLPSEEISQVFYLYVHPLSLDFKEFGTRMQELSFYFFAWPFLFLVEETFDSHQ